MQEPVYWPVRTPLRPPGHRPYAAIMAPIPADVARLCENPQSRGAMTPLAELIRGDRVDVWLGPPIYPGLSVVLNHREAAGEVVDVVAGVRALLRARGRDRATWMVGSSADPDLPNALRAFGMTPDDDPVLHGLVLRRPPVAGAGDVDVDVVRVEEAAQMRDFLRIQQVAFGSGPAGAEFVDALWAAERGCAAITTYLAMLDGRPVATARCTFAPAGATLNGGATLPEARGRGAYRALVAARWDDAVGRGTPFLTTLARPTSHPILLRLGFEKCCEVRSLIDAFTAPAGSRHRAP